MPSKKPKIQVLLDEKEYIKFKKIAEKEDRTESNLGKQAIQKFIENYERENGKINIINIEGDNHGNINM